MVRLKVNTAPEKKRCIVCGNDFTPALHGHQILCPKEDCHKKRQQELRRSDRMANPERYREYGRAHVARHPERVRAQQQAFHAKHPEKKKVYMKGYRARNPGKVRALNLKSYHRHREKRIRHAKEVRADLKARAVEAERLRAEIAELKRRRDPGRPKNEQVRRRVLQLRAATPPTSWNRVKLILDRETGERRSLSTYRGYAENPR